MSYNKNIAVGCFGILLIISVLFGATYYSLFCLEVHTGEEFVAKWIKGDTVYAQGRTADFVYNGNEYVWLTGDYYYKLSDDDLEFLGYKAYRGIIRENFEHELYDIKSDDSDQFLYLERDLFDSNSNIFYRDDFVIPEITVENIESVELYSAKSGLMYGEQMNKIEPNHVITDSEIISALLHEFQKNDKKVIFYGDFESEVLINLVNDIGKWRYYVCLTFKGYSDNFCYLLGEM